MNYSTLIIMCFSVFDIKVEVIMACASGISVEKPDASLINAYLEQLQKKKKGFKSINKKQL